jgi:hypothetical protein
VQRFNAARLEDAFAEHTLDLDTLERGAPKPAT